MPNTCAVEGCINHANKNNPEISFFSFPKEEYYIKEWQKICRKENINPKHARICSVHFRPNNYKEKSYADIILNTTPKCTRKLRKDAIPTENLFKTLESAALDSELNTDSATEDTINYTFANGSTATVNLVTKGTDTTKIDIDAIPTKDTTNLTFAEIPTAENLMETLENTTFNHELNFKSKAEGIETTKIDIDVIPTENLFVKLENADVNSGINTDSSTKDTQNGTFAEIPTGTISTSERTRNNELQNIKNTINSKFQALEALISQHVSKEDIEKHIECIKELVRRFYEEINKLRKERLAESERINKELKDQAEMYRLQWLEAKESEAYWKKQCQIYKMRAEYAESKLNIVSAETDAILNELKKVFTPAQIKILLNPEKRARRNREEIAGVISTRSLSSKIDLYLRKVLKIPLPRLSSLRRGINRCDVEPGVLKNILKIIEKKGNKLRNSDKITVVTNYKKFRNLKKVHFF